MNIGNVIVKQTRDTEEKCTVPEALEKFLDQLQFYDATGPVQELSPDTTHPLGNRDVCFFRVNRIACDSEYPHREAFENTLLSMDNPGFNVVYILDGSSSGVNLSIGVVRNSHDESSSGGSVELSASDYGKMLGDAFNGNFGGSEIKSVRGKSLQKLLYNNIERLPYAGVVTGIPSINKSKDVQATDDSDYQGIDRLIGAMLGSTVTWRIVVVCEPMCRRDVLQTLSSVHSLYGAVASRAKESVQASMNFSESTGWGKTSSFTKGTSQGWSETKGTSEGWSETRGTSQSRSETKGTSQSRSKTHGTSEGWSETRGTASSRDKKSGESSTSNSTNRSTSSSSTTSTSTSTTNSTSQSTTNSTSSSMSNSTNGSMNQSATKNGGNSSSDTTGSNESESHTSGIGQSSTVERIDKRLQELMKYIDEELLERLRLGASKGMYRTCIYYMADTPAGAVRLKNNMVSLFQGNSSVYSPLSARGFHALDKEAVAKVVDSYQVWSEFAGLANPMVPMLYGRPAEGASTGLCTCLTAREVSLLAGLPQKEVPGLALEESVDFGLNVPCPNEAEKNIRLGRIMQRGRELNLSYTLQPSALSKHIFIAGVTGSGKTTTCQRLLQEAGTHFLVIEPAKTEYRAMLGSVDGLIVFTVGNEGVAPFRLNPFEFAKGEVLSSNVDMLKATFTSAFPMEASMPQLLEEAIYETYRRKGWDIDTGEHSIYGDEAFSPESMCFPMLSDLLEVLKVLPGEKGFSHDMEADYVGSLTSRLSNLTVGSKGAMFNCPKSVDFDFIVDNNVVLEMEDLKAPEDKALVMGFVLSRLAVTVKHRHQKDTSFRHVTLVEEAHRLLSKVDAQDGARRSAVETFTDLLAEVRKYGEGLVIVDQIPNKLTPDVLKNTNTKIIHRLLARDDREAVGDTMGMKDEQKTYLTRLGVGHAIVFNEDADKPIHVKIDMLENLTTSDEMTPNSKVRRRFAKKKSMLGPCYMMTDYKRYVGDLSELAQVLYKNGERREDLIAKLSSAMEKMALANGIAPLEAWENCVRTAMLYGGASSVNSDEIISRDCKLLAAFFAGENPPEEREALMNSQPFITALRKICGDRPKAEAD